MNYCTKNSYVQKFSLSKQKEHFFPFLQKTVHCIKSKMCRKILATIQLKKIGLYSSKP